MTARHEIYYQIYCKLTHLNVPGATYLKYTYNRHTPSQHGHNAAHSFWQHMSIHLSLGCSTPQ